MDSSKLPKNSKYPENNQDRISNLPSAATNKILKRLPLPMVAKMSVLSTKWRAKWVSHKYLVFDEAFWKAQGDNSKRVNKVVTNTLLHHNGPLHKFFLVIPEFKGKSINLNQYLSFLSRTRVKKIVIINSDESVADIPIPSHLFACKELVRWRLDFFIFNPPPSGFKGFAYLRYLELGDIEFNCDILASLIASCPRLEVLRLVNFTGITNLVIDSPNLEVLDIRGGYASLHFKSVVNLSGIGLSLEPTADDKALYNDMLNLIKLLATSCELHWLQFGGQMCQVTENSNAAQHNIEFNDSYKLNHLMTMKIRGITGSSAGLKFIEYMLSISVVLESLYFKCGNLDPTAELKVSRNLMRLRRASTKAQLICLDQ